MNISLLSRFVALALLSLGWSGVGLRAADDLPPGSGDIVTVFAKAVQGAPLRYAAIGGSITQPWIGAWLQEQFPKRAIYIQNAGMSATGSDLGVFRLDRDVIAYQPDLVLIECVVNDGGLKDEAAMRYFESEVVRLRKLPHPPAIMLVIAGQEVGMHKERHRRIAEHYGVFVIDLDVVLHAYMAEKKLPWLGLMKDAVHPTDAGHALYSKWIAEKLQPLADKAKAMKRDMTQVSLAHPLPEPVSAKPLLLDGRLVSLSEAVNWKVGGVSDWWSKFFTGVATAKEPGTTLIFPFRGRAIGLWYTLGEERGSFYASVDGGFPEQILTNTRKGYDYRIFANNLEPCEHVLTVVLPQSESPNGAFKTNGEVDLGYALVAGEAGASSKQTPQGIYTAEALKQLRFTPVAAKDYVWAGPFGGTVADVLSGKASADLEMVFAPEAGALAGKFAGDFKGVDGKAVQWQALKGDDAFVDLAALTGLKDRGVSYVATNLQAAQAGDYILRVTCDYYMKLWVNGELVKTFAEGHGGPRSPVLLPVRLKAGRNELVLKVHPGSGGCSYSVSVGTLGAVVTPMAVK